MAAKMNPHQLRHVLPEFSEDHDAQIYKFPVDDWDRLELWAARETAKLRRTGQLRDFALSRI